MGSDAKVNVLIKSTIASRDVTKMFRNGTNFMLYSMTGMVIY